MATPCPVDECTLSIDIILRSSDGKRLGSHTKNLEVFNTAFPSANIVSHDPEDVIDLSEDGDLLELLLRFSHNREFPDLSTLRIHDVLTFERTADKYGNSFAGLACKEAIHTLAQRTPEAALQSIPYKILHSDMRDIDMIVRSTMEFSTRQVVNELKYSTPRAICTYMLYKTQWEDQLRSFKTTLEDMEPSTKIERESIATLKSLLAFSPSMPAFEFAMDYCRSQNKFRFVNFGLSIGKIRQALNGLPRWEEIYNTV
ncbi:hypothetical protein VNI00_016366 [Paramarasmius palmivorus]|uniref:BTB domain-containing protein n=1 Tax=Paramarasmius palmivorus TaxID=297713 RepID=A0AAW0BEM2_9AGAR